MGRTSLEALELAPSLAYLALPENEDAISTALPVPGDEELLGESVDAGSDIVRRRQFQGALSQGPATPAFKPYASAIETLGLHLPHLINVRTLSHQQATVAISRMEKGPFGRTLNLVMILSNSGSTTTPLGPRRPR